jgi:hypothetical protein
MRSQIGSATQIMAVALIIAVLPGCASIINGKTQTVSFQSTPSGATVSLSGMPIGVTPISTVVQRKNDQTLFLLGLIVLSPWRRSKAASFQLIE